VDGADGVAESEGAEAVGAEATEAAEAGRAVVVEGGEREGEGEEEWRGGGLRTAVREPSYGQLRRVREQLQRPARTWSLEMGGRLLLRRTGGLGLGFGLGLGPGFGLGLGFGFGFGWERAVAAHG
jgi:hypothetical protein